MQFPNVRSRPPGFPSTGSVRDYRALPRRFRRKRLLIVGCGDVGCRVAARLAGRWTVYGVVRSDDALDRVRRAGAVPLRAEPARARRLQALAGAVLHSAPPPADAYRRRPGDRRGGAAGHGVAEDPVTRDWLVRLAGRRIRARHGAPPRLVYLSTTGVYGDRAGARVDETTRVAPVTDRARRRVDAEARLRAASRPRRRPAQTGRRRPAAIAATVLRVPGIYALDRLPLARLRQRVPALIPADDVRTHHIHADDLARVAIAALLHGPAPRTINVVDDTQLLLGDYLDQVADWAGLARPPRVDRTTLLQTISPVRASFMSESRQIDNTRLGRELRVALRYRTVADFLRAHDQPPPGTDPAAGPDIMRTTPL